MSSFKAAISTSQKVQKRIESNRYAARKSRYLKKCRMFVYHDMLLAIQNCRTLEDAKIMADYAIKYVPSNIELPAVDNRYSRVVAKKVTLKVIPEVNLKIIKEE